MQHFESWTVTTIILAIAFVSEPHAYSMKKPVQLVTSSHHTQMELQTVANAHQLFTILQKAAHAHMFKISNHKGPER